MKYFRFDEYASGQVPKGFVTVMRDVIDRKSVNKIQDILHDEIFREYFEHKDLLDIIEVFTGPNIMAMHSMLIAKPPDVGSGSSRWMFLKSNILLKRIFLWQKDHLRSIFIKFLV